jgi:hypothetical protein
MSMDVIQTALAGLQSAQASLEATSVKLARGLAPVDTGAGVDTVDLSAAMVALLQSKHHFSANIAVLETAGEMEQRVLDILA